MEGYGPLDLFLARWRYKMAIKKMELVQKNGRILDIGCGSYPLFLTIVDFKEKYGLDKNIDTAAIGKMKQQSIVLKNHRIEEEQRIPFDDDYFDVVTMLAVFEHIEPRELVKIHREIRRILKPGGLYIMTTPTVWTDGLLKLLLKLRLISDTISEHKDNYSHAMISSVLKEAGFEKDRLRFGYFELFMNTWVTANK